VLAFLILPLALQGSTASPASITLFCCGGLGYILVEIASSSASAFLGHPTYALTVVIFLLMLSSGAKPVLAALAPRQKWLGCRLRWSSPHLS